LKKARSQKGSLCLSVNGSGTRVWNFRWWETKSDGSRVRRKRQVGTLNEYQTAEAAERAVRNLRLEVLANQSGTINGMTMSELINHFRAWSTCNRYESNLNCWIEPRWGKEVLTTIKAPQVEKWLHTLVSKPRKRKEPRPVLADKDLKALAPGSKAKIRNLMSVLFNHAIRWQFAERNPIQGPLRGGRAGVRQSSKRENIPDILEIAEVQAIVSKLRLRERTLLFLAMSTGLRRGELAGLKWQDVAFDKMLLFVERSVVDQVVGPCKTEGSKKPVPMDEYTAQDLNDWFRETPYRAPEDWVFASNSRRAGKKRGKQPLWLSSIMRYHIQPVVKELGIQKLVSWHTFRRTYTSLLTANNENVKVVQELLRHGSVRITMDVYAQAKMQDKRDAQRKVVEEFRPHLAKSA
jgi:integrase